MAAQVTISPVHTGRQTTTDIECATAWSAATISWRALEPHIQNIKNRHIETTFAAEPAVRPRRPAPILDQHLHMRTPVPAASPGAAGRVYHVPVTHAPHHTEDGDPTMDDIGRDEHAPTCTQHHDLSPRRTGTACTTIDHFKRLREFDMRTKHGNAYAAFPRPPKRQRVGRHHKSSSAPDAPSKRNIYR